ncbi:AI-2E family transporter [Pontibacter sp. G13]|uniref:AI-2E family transporter n=1 Tax=Pontibacter sp. G13 TaxID=3074898 RepID=UPI002889E6C0|nr:AI-2E family transporter [Pontibacter sp. G13]WNJ19831.1 AI-2E family transporter [Pontibacter sp. G13]
MKPWQQTLLIIASIILVGVLVYFFHSIFAYILVAAIMGMIGRPVMELLDKVHIQRFYLPNAIKAIITLFVIYGGLFTLFLLLIPPIISRGQELSTISTNPGEFFKGLEAPLMQLEAFLKDKSLIPSDASLPNMIRETIISFSQDVLDIGQVSDAVKSLAGATGGFFAALFSVTFISFFFLEDRGLFRRIILTITPDAYDEKMNNVLTNIRPLLTRYFVGVLLEVLLVGGLISLGLFILGVEDALMIGFFAGCFNVIPYLGPIIGAVMGLLLTTLGGLHMEFYSQLLPLLAKVAVVFAIVQLIDNMVFQPLIYSSSVKAHPLEIFLVILMAGSIAGVGGMILAIPTYTLIRVIAKEFFSEFKIVQSITKSI